LVQGMANRSDCEKIERDSHRCGQSAAFAVAIRRRLPSATPCFSKAPSLKAVPLFNPTHLNA
jgi:hypothetical protein